MPDVTVTSDIDTFLKSSNNSTARTNLGAESAPTSIANKEAAYALTGVAAGTVYKTEDTGQVMEYLGDVLPLYGGFTIAGSTGQDMYTLTYNGNFVFTGKNSEGRATYRDLSTGQQFAGNASSLLVGTIGLGHTSVAGLAVHPADVPTWSTVMGSGSLLQSEFTKADPESNPYNWKIDGVIEVFDNDEKLLLTNLPDGQQVEIVGEGGRLERFNGDGDGLNEGDFKILVNHPDDPVISGYRINGIYTSTGSGYYNNSDGMILGADSSGVYIFYSGSVDWSAPINGLATPDLMSPWTAVSTTAQGYAAMTSDMITRQPAATESNWSDIIPTAEIILDDTVDSTGMSWNGSAVQGATAVNYGWHQLDRPYPFTAYNVESVTRDGLTTTEGVGGGTGAAQGVYNQSGTNFTAMFNDNKKVRSITITQGA